MDPTKLISEEMWQQLLDSITGVRHGDLHQRETTYWRTRAEKAEAALRSIESARCHDVRRFGRKGRHSDATIRGDHVTRLAAWWQRCLDGVVTLGVHLGIYRRGDW